MGWLRARVDAVLDREGPGTQAAIMRVALVALLWDRWASDFLLYKADTAVHWLIYGSYMVATPLLFVGLWTQLAAWWTAATMLAVFYGLGVMEGVEPYTHHHTWLLTMFAVLMPLVPSGKSFSVDRWLALRKAARTGNPPPSDRGPMWAMPLIGLQLSAMYIWATFDKCTWAFASGQRLHHIFQWYYGSADPIAIPGFEWMMAGMAITTIVAESGLAILPWFARPRPWIVLFGVVFHGMLFMALPVGPFSATVWAMYLAYWPAEEVDVAVRRLLGPAHPSATPA